MKKVIAGLAAAALVLAGGAASSQELDSAGGDHHKPKKEKRDDWHPLQIWLRSVPEEGDVETVIDNSGGPEDGVTEPGDRILFTETLYALDAQHQEPEPGKAIGAIYVDCSTFTVSDPDPVADGEEGEDATLQCVATMSVEEPIHLADAPGTDHPEQLEPGDLYLQAQFAYSELDPFTAGSITGGILGGSDGFAGDRGSFQLWEGSEGEPLAASTYLLTLDTIRAHPAQVDDEFPL